MSNGIFITATGTDTGKTYITALLVKKLRDAGLNAGYYKTAISGAIRQSDQSLLPGDADYVNRMADIRAPLSELVSYVYEPAVSPHLAAEIEGNPVDETKIRADYQHAASRFDYLTMEGSGGIVCPIRDDAQKTLFLTDFIKMFHLPILIVSTSGLGSINNAILTASYAAAHNIPVKGFILNDFHPGSRMEEDNRAMIEKFSGIPVLACVEKNDRELPRDASFWASLYE